MREKNMKPQSWENHLVERAQTGEAVAFDLLIDMHRPALRAQAMRFLRNAEDADDAVQEAIIKTYKGLKGFQKGRPVLPWMLRITTNCCIDQMRGNGRTAGESIDKYEWLLTDDSRGAEDTVEASLLGEAVHKAVMALPEKYRDIVTMRHFNHMDVAEIAESLGKPEGTVKSWLFRARALLRENLQVAVS